MTDSEPLRQTPFSSCLLRRTEAEVADQMCLYFPTGEGGHSIGEGGHRTGEGGHSTGEGGHSRESI